MNFAKWLQNAKMFWLHVVADCFSSDFLRFFGKNSKNSKLKRLPDFNFFYIFILKVFNKKVLKLIIVLFYI